MKKLLLVFSVLSMVIFACGEDNSKKKLGSSKDKKEAKAKKVANGEKIYKKNCVICHGTRGDMGASGAFNLTTSELSLDERITVVTKGRNTMVGFEAILDEDEIAAVAKFSMSLKKD
ncbi:MAG: cytochrome c [Saprospiraceae bacterium]